MGTKVCIWCGAKWPYEGTQEEIASVCPECRERTDRMWSNYKGERVLDRVHSEKEEEKRRKYKTSLMNFPWMRQFFTKLSENEKEKCSELLKLLKMRRKIVALNSMKRFKKAH